LLVAPLLAVLALLVVYPLVKLVQMSLEQGGLRTYGAYFQNAGNLRVLRTTFQDSAEVTAVALIVGSLLAWSLRLARSRLTRTLLWTAVLVPFLMGTVVKNYALTIVLGRHGVLNDALVGLHIVRQPLELLYTEKAVVAGMLYAMLPYAVLPMYVAFLTLEPDLVVAAQSLGASRVRAICTIVLPLALPSFLATAILVFVISIGFYVTPVILGGATSPFAATFIQNAMFQFFDLPGAATSAVVLVAAGALAVLLGVAVVGPERLRRAVG
jgi:putative spermidine/putrescine transport system permease protein